MNPISRFLFGGAPPPNPISNASNAYPHPSMRGGLPEMIDMLRAQPSYIFERSDIDKGDKVLLPASILESILDKFGNLPQPMIFSISPIRTRKTTFVGVLEFVAPANTVIIPFWLFKDMELNEGETIRLGLVDQLPKATFLKIRPHKTKFIDLGDPTAILNKHLRDFTVVKKDQTIMIHVLKEDYQLDIVDIKPQNQYNAVLLINADIHLEFEAPLDYIEPDYKKNIKKDEKTAKPVLTGVRIDNKEIKESVMAVEQKDYDPRTRKIPRGIRREWYADTFVGSGTAIGRK